jgi:hypothetical protein
MIISSLTLPCNGAKLCVASTMRSGDSEVTASHFDLVRTRLNQETFATTTIVKLNLLQIQNIA